MFLFKKTGIEQLQKELRNAKNFKSTAYVEVDGVIRMAQITSDENCKFIRSYLFAGPGCLMSKHLGHDTIAEAFTELKNLLPTGKIYLETVTVLTEKKNLLETSRSAWSEALGHQKDHGSALDKSKTPEDSCELILRDNLWKKLTGGMTGVQKWNNTEPDTRRLIAWNGSKLEGADLKTANLSDLHFKNALFEKADLEGAYLTQAAITGANFSDANLFKTDLSGAVAGEVNFTNACLKNANLSRAYLAKSVFKNTDLKKANLSNANLQGVDLTTAIIDGAKFTCAIYDEKTVLPPNFLQWSDLLWQGKGADPYKALVKEKIKNMAVNQFDEMLAHVKAHFDASRLDKVLKMLKKERFELFAEPDAKTVYGVVKSQTDPDRIYACSLSDGGEYSCCTQNLRPCGGLKGEVCKHILVLVLGLARAQKIDLTDATKWILTTIDKEPSIDKAAMTEVFLRYQAASAGEIDWRPTETIPEDYYSY